MLHGTCPGKAVARTYFQKPIENPEKATRILSNSPHSVLEETLSSAAYRLSSCSPVTRIGSKCDYHCTVSHDLRPGNGLPASKMHARIHTYTALFRIVNTSLIEWSEEEDFL